MLWAQDTEVSDWLGQPVDTRMTQALDAANAYCQRTRPDLSPETDPPADVRQAVIVYAALLWRERVTPAGFATYAEIGNGDGDPSSAMVNVYRLLGSRRPVAR
jgi:hypothetical protein